MRPGGSLTPVQRLSLRDRLDSLLGGFAIALWAVGVPGALLRLLGGG